MMRFFERDLIRSSDGKNEYFVVRVCYERNKIALANKNDWFKKGSQYKKPVIYTFHKMDNLLKSGKFQKIHGDILSLPPFMLKTDKWLENAEKDKWIARRNKDRKRISPIIDNEEILSRYIFGESIVDEINSLQKSNSEKSPGTIYRLLNRYLTFGAIDNALLPISYAKCGNRIEWIYSGIKPIKRGRKTRINHLGQKVDCRSKTRGITAQDKINILKLMKEESIANKSSYKKFNKDDLYNKYLEKYACHIILRETGTEDQHYRWLFDEEDRISKQQFYFHLKHLLSDEEILRHKLGAVNFEKDEKVKTGLARDGIIGPGYCYAIDATILDIYVRYPYDPNVRSCGRPVLYLVVDVWSTCIVGYYLGFHGPDWVGAGEALYHACINKSKWAQSIGWKLEEGTWSCHHVPFAVMGDNGSEYSERNIISMLDAEIGIKMMIYVPIYRGDAKGVVERKFKIGNDNFVHLQPGYVHSETLRELPHAANNAVWDFRSLVIAIGKEIVWHNNNANRLKKHNFIMSRDYVGISPQSIYNYGIEKEMDGGRIITDKSRLRFAFLREVEATVHGDCVMFKNIEYEYPNGIEQGIYGKAKYRGSYKIPVRITSCTMDYMWHKDDNGKVVELTLKDKDHWARNQRREIAYSRLEEYAQETFELEEKALRERMQLNFEHDQARAINSAQIIPSKKRKGMPQGIKEAKEVMAGKNIRDHLAWLRSDFATNKPSIESTADHDNDNEFYGSFE
ncbi:MAG: hypothetical protein HPY82_23645 [Gammaproteobacteria bacterium]|nr:hypothetical protein [Gammaproteobacteria bacterium]